MWSSGKTSPPYSAIIRLIELGVTLEELFGKEHADILLRNGNYSQKDSFGGDGKITQQQILDGVKKALSELIGSSKAEGK